ncbi:hypothetical protein ACIPWY_20250 [Streptomyces sp. NPDC090032]|uniref:hypothetical protein n=1 Tax=unclassified Streptomyces TaxID=2593676 RepID=UPI00371FF387
MRRRTTVAASLAAFALALSLPASAHAATGEFSYKFIGLDGRTQSVTLLDPPTYQCITLPEVADPDSSEPAFAPHNNTGDWAMVFTEPDCEGDSWTLRPHGKQATDQLKLRSVLLTPAGN